jgi:hypothetical protein
MIRKRLAGNLVSTGLLLLAVAACGSAFVFLSQFGKVDEEIPFDAARWNAPMTDPNGHFTGTRLKMVDDLLRCYDFRGWSARNVQGLLGEPDYERVEEQRHLLEYDLRDGLNLCVCQSKKYPFDNRKETHLSHFV